MVAKTQERRYNVATPFFWSLGRLVVLPFGVAALDGFLFILLNSFEVFLILQYFYFWKEYDIAFWQCYLI